MNQLTLVELVKRLNDLIDSNIKMGRSNRNELPVKVRINQYGKLRKNGRRGFKSEYVPLYRVDSSMYGDGKPPNGNYMVIMAQRPDADATEEK